MDSVDTVRAYYEAIDAHDYDALSEVLDEGFTQRRPDRTFEGRDEFVTFMREHRPHTETTHEIDAVYREPTEAGESTETEVVVRGRLLDADRGLMFGFADVHRLVDGRVVELSTYTC
ncbi:MAG: nuclear transport factor 2 family protein [Halobacteriota archaeon]